MLRRLLHRVGQLLASTGEAREIATHHELNKLVGEVEIDDGDEQGSGVAAAPPAPAAPEGLVPCGLCGVPAAVRGNWMSVHYPSITARKPCPASWPPMRSKS